MNILLYSVNGDGVGLAHQLISEGHQVVVHFNEEKDAEQGKGMFWTSTSWQSDARAADFVIFDGNGKGSYADNLRKDGIKVWNGGDIADRLEHDRAFGMKVFEATNIPIPETFYFKDGKEAKECVAEHFTPKERSVIKLNKSTSASSYCANGTEDMVGQIEAWEESMPQELAHGGIIQKFIDGIEISIEGWFNGEDFMYPFNWTMEDKKLLAGNLGPNVGCAYSCCRMIRATNPMLAKVMMKPLKAILKRARYTGQIDVNTIVANDGSAYALEFTPRPGYEGTSNLVQVTGGYGEAIRRTFDPEWESLVREQANAFDFVSALRLWVPPYPFEGKTKPLHREVYDSIRGVPIDAPLSVAEGFVPYDAQLNEEGEMVMAGTCGVVGVTLGRGNTPDRAAKECISKAERIEVPNMAYRIDAGDRVKKQITEIEDLGWLR